MIRNNPGFFRVAQRLQFDNIDTEDSDESYDSENAMPQAQEQILIEHAENPNNNNASSPNKMECLETTDCSTAPFSVDAFYSLRERGLTSSPNIASPRRPLARLRSGSGGMTCRPYYQTRSVSKAFNGVSYKDKQNKDSNIRNRVRIHKPKIKQPSYVRLVVQSTVGTQTPKVFGNGIQPQQVQPLPSIPVFSFSKSNLPMEDLLQMQVPCSPQKSPRQRSLALATSSPPYRRVKALKLFDNPATPKTVLQHSTGLFGTANRASLFPRSVPRPNAVAVNHEDKKPNANLNPFTPAGMMMSAKRKKRSRSKRDLDDGSFICGLSGLIGDSDEEIEQPTKKIALQDSNITRFHQEFHELCLIGKGEFGSVHKCINRLDGCVYAIKKSLKPVAGNTVYEKSALNEVYAHAVLGKHPHVVSYYSAWAENDHMIIQNEYCNGGSLADAIELNRKMNKRFSEAELMQITRHVAEGLKYIHSHQLVHMDIKPGNIFISRESTMDIINYCESSDDGFEEEAGHAEKVYYKIGDLGHVTSICNPQVEEGDCRFLPREILDDNYEHLSKADIFALGLTVYEAATLNPLPKNGDDWHAIRAGKLGVMDNYSKDIHNILTQMIHESPARRPTAAQIAQHRILCPNAGKTKEQLRRELNEERLRNSILSKQLDSVAKSMGITTEEMCSSYLEDSNHTSDVVSVRNRQSRLIGGKGSRSFSTTTF